MASITRRNNRYVVDINSGGVRKSKTFELRRDAKRWADETEKQIKAGAYNPASDRTFKDVADQYYFTMRKIKPLGKTKQQVIGRISQADGNNLGHHIVTEMTAQDFIAFAVNRSQTCKPSTVLGDIVYAGEVLKTAEAMWDEKVNIAEFNKAVKQLKKIGVIGESEERDQRCSDDQLEEILSQLPNLDRGTTIPVADVAKFAIATAMRWNEIFQCRWDELGDEGRSIAIWRKHPKKRYQARVPLTKEAVEIIKRQPKTSEFIFPYNQKTVATYFQQARNRCEGETRNIRCHDLRHEGITRLFERGLDSMTVALFSGHRDINMLRRYTHLNATKILETL